MLAIPSDPSKARFIGRIPTSIFVLLCIVASILGAFVVLFLSAIFYAICRNIFSITDEPYEDLIIISSIVVGLIVPIFWLRHKRKKYRRKVPAIAQPQLPNRASADEPDAGIGSQALQAVNQQLAALSSEVARLRMERDAAEEGRLKAERQANEARQRNSQPQVLEEKHPLLLPKVLEEKHPQLLPSTYGRPILVFIRGVLVILMIAWMAFAAFINTAMLFNGQPWRMLAANEIPAWLFWWVIWSAVGVGPLARLYWYLWVGSGVLRIRS
jgi:hypothetical protein